MKPKPPQHRKAPQTAAELAALAGVGLEALVRVGRVSEVGYANRTRNEFMPRMRERMVGRPHVPEGAHKRGKHTAWTDLSH